MKYSLLLLAMIFMHIVDDYYLQGILATMKQKSWWQQSLNELYKHDYIVALVMHAFSWTFMITLPILFATHWQPHWAIILMFGINVVIHAITDDLKANKKKINLIADQSIHIAQVWATWLVYWLISIT